ncbi:MAG: alkaline phosphatase family protein [Thermodesulfobacteriota bacterium]
MSRQEQTSPPARRRVLVMGLDGATFDLMGPWMAEGRLPNLARLAAYGAHGPLDPAPNLRSAASWTSFATGANPGRHGIYEFYDFEPQSYGIRFVNGGERAVPALWQLADAAGLATVSVNVPMSYPAEALAHGILLAGLDAPGTASPGFCHPAGILAELEDRFGRYIIEPGLTGCIVDGRLDEAVALLFAEIEQKRQVALALLQEKPWDLGIIVFRSLDAAQHCFWKHLDPGHPAHDPGLAARYGSVIPRVYQTLDAIAGELCGLLGPEDVFVILSDHGAGPKHPAANQLNAWLAAHGYLAYQERRPGLGPAVTTALQAAYRLVAAKLPRRGKEAIARLLPGLRNRVQSRLCFTGIDWSRTRAYSDTLFANIRLNLAGREGQGIVSPGAEAAALLAELKAALLDCRDAASGERIVEAVLLRDEIYHGAHAGRAPDLTIRWREDGRISGLALPGGPADQDPAAYPLIPAEDARVISGDHRRFGVFFAAGHGIRPDFRLADARIIDVAPTILALLGLPIPDHMDGRVLAELLAEPVASGAAGGGKPPAPPAPAAGQPARTYTGAEREAIAQRMRDLGYLE